jgi:hypothetical protein
MVRILGKLWHIIRAVLLSKKKNIIRAVLGLKTILKGELDHKEEFVPLFEEQSYQTHLR